MKQIGMMVMALLLTVTFTYAQDNKQSPKATVDGKVIDVTYNQPSLRGRAFGKELAPYGKVWRTGADAATTVVFAKDVKFGGKDVKAGTYTLYTIPTEKEWTVILNKQNGQWGTVYDEKQDLLRVTAPVKKASSPTEKFTIKVDDKANASDLVMMWADATVSVPVTY
ncbi:DUF2911 domain-containing protein [Rhodocytophaga rosea]|uniref:DUF2911 domain-containing protein n=1 Tax=Rhodocytophaga rosea TaxID=2704465 RepID=A0A6C0GTR4_9BACT|nr:DUF2911 domain-containing protein [Rhodocytophaga rosea]QHT71555.1 DUF2911 domain-containing protein [Rhodocytophaga rosea]